MFSGDNLVSTKNGLKYAKNVLIGDEVFGSNGFVPVKNIIKKDELLCSIENNYMVDSKFTKDQKFLTRDNTKIYNVVLSELKEDDIICMIIGDKLSFDKIKLETFIYEKLKDGNRSNRLNETVKFPDTIDNDLAYFLGYFYGDGCVEKDKNYYNGLSLACSNDYPEIKVKLCKILSEQFDATVYVNKGDGALETVDVYSRVVMNNLLNNGIMKQKAGELIFPEKVLFSDSDTQFSFISGFFDADGCYQRSKKSYRFSSIDVSFLRSIQKIMLSNGIVTNMTVENRSKQGWRDLYRLEIIGRESISKFRDLCWQSHKIQSNEFINKIDHITTIYNSHDLNINYSKYSFSNSKDLLSYKSFNLLKNFYNVVDIKVPVIIKSYVENIKEFGVDTCYSFDVDCKGIWVDGYYALI